MKRKIIPLKLNATGTTVSNLHVALRLLGYEVSIGEISARKFGNSTRLAIRKFQKESGLSVGDDVDKATANALNDLMSNSEIVAELKTHGQTLGSISAGTAKLADIDSKLAKLNDINIKLGKAPRPRNGRITNSK